MKRTSEQEKFYGTMNSILAFIGYFFLLILGFYLMAYLFPDSVFALLIPPIFLIILYYVRNKRL